MACKKEIEELGGVLKWLTTIYNSYVTSGGSGTIYLLMGKNLFNHYSENLYSIQKFTESVPDQYMTQSVMFKASKCFCSQKPGWALTIVGPYGILEA